MDHIHNGITVFSSRIPLLLITFFQFSAVLVYRNGLMQRSSPERLTLKKTSYGDNDNNQQQHNNNATTTSDGIPPLLWLNLSWNEEEPPELADHRDGVGDNDVDGVVAVVAAAEPEEETLFMGYDGGNESPAGADESIVGQEYDHEPNMDEEEEFVASQEYYDLRNIMLSILINNAKDNNPTEIKRLFHRLDVPDWLLSRATMACPHNYVPDGTNITVYSPTYGDRSGAVIEHMINAYAYAYEHGFNYGGSIPRVHDQRFPIKQELHEHLIKSMGLDDVLKFATPTHHPRQQNNNNKRDNKDSDNDPYFLWVELCLPSFKTGETQLSSSFIKHLQSRQRLPTSTTTTTDLDGLADSGERRRKQRVAVHIRRGDAQPCTAMKFRKRYSPNVYYLRVIQQYADDDADVTIFSESDSFESLDVFRHHGYKLRLDGPTTEAWNEMRTADILIMSPHSFFSLVPALLNPNKVYFSLDINNWIGVSEKIQDERKQVMDLLINERCESWLEEHPEHRQAQTPFFFSQSMSMSEDER